MAASQNNESPGKPGRKDNLPKGVRGPGGPRPVPSNTAGSMSGSASRPASGAPSSRRRALEERSYPLLRRMSGLPRWIVVVTPAILLFLGLVLTGPLAWIGGILLLLVAALLAWLTALSWPAITAGSRLLRSVVVIAVAGIAVLKLIGRF